MTCDEICVGFVYAMRHHAITRRFDNNADTQRFKVLIDRIRDLRRRLSPPMQEVGTHDAAFQRAIEGAAAGVDA
jgi:hypothetical protein